MSYAAKIEKKYKKDYKKIIEKLIKAVGKEEILKMCSHWIPSKKKIFIIDKITAMISINDRNEKYCGAYCHFKSGYDCGLFGQAIGTVSYEESIREEVMQCDRRRCYKCQKHIIATEE